MRYVSLLVCVSVFLAGCKQPTPPETSEQKETRLQKFGETQFPENAKKVMDIGNGWYTFELKTDGVTRKFLFHRICDYVGDGQSAQESITEMSPAPLP